MSHRRRPSVQAPIARRRRGFATFVGVMALFASVGLGMALKYDVQRLGGPDLVFSKDASAAWALLGKAIVVAPGVVSAYAFAGLTRRRDFLSVWLGLVAGGLAFHVPLLLPDHVGVVVILGINIAQAVLALLLSRTARFVKGLQAFESVGSTPS